MTLAEHLRELRSRLVRAFLIIGVGVVVAFVWYQPVFRFLTHPYCALPISHRLGGTGCNLVFLGIFDPFMVRLKVAVIVGVVLTTPLWLYQVWAFIAPGLHRHERRWAVIFAACSGVLFAAGCVVAYLTLSRGLAFLLSFATGLTPLITIDRYLSFVEAMLIIFGVSFEFPLLIVLLNFSGMLSARRLAQSWRGIVFGLFVFAAVATPSQDPISMLGMALPMTALYGVALVVAFAHDRRAARRDAADPYRQLADDQTSTLDLDDDALAEPPVLTTPRDQR